MIAYDAWDRDYLENQEHYQEIFHRFMSQTNYEDTEVFEHTFAELADRKHAVTVASATDALCFSLLSQGIGAGDEVLVTDFSWISTASCISMIGAIPVFCDIDLDSYHISFDSIKRMVSPKTRAIMYTHLFGNMSDTSKIENFCREKGIAIIEDAAQSLGSSLNKRKAGSIGDCSSFSFNTNKVVAGLYGGGVCLTDDQSKAEYVEKLRRHGQSRDFELVGYNSRMYVLNAEIINFRIQQMTKNKQRRQAIASIYNQNFNQLPIIVQKQCTELDHNFHKYVIRCEDNHTREQLRNKLQASVHYNLPLSRNSMYQNIYHRKDNCINSQIAADTVLSLPIHAWLTDEEINIILASVKEQFL